MRCRRWWDKQKWIISLIFFIYFILVFKHLSAPVYVFVAQWDSYQLQELVHSKFPTMRLPPELPSEAEYLGKFGKNTHRSLRRVGSFNWQQCFCNNATVCIIVFKLHCLLNSDVRLKLSSRIWQPLVWHALVQFKTKGDHRETCSFTLNFFSLLL